MRILLDGEPISRTTAGTVGEAITAAADLAGQRGRMIIEVSVDGAAWSEHQIADELTGATAAEEVSLTSADAVAVVAAAYRDAAQALAEADGLQRDAADLLQADRRAESLELLNESLQIWQSVQQAVVMGLHAAPACLDDDSGLETRITGAVDRLNHHLTIIRDALQSGDPVGVSDTLLYDLPEVVQDWRALLHELETTVGHDNPENPDPNPMTGEVPE